MSHIIKVVAGLLGITLKHATTKYAQTIELLERSPLSIKQTFKIEQGDGRSVWHICVSAAVPNYNTSYTVMAVSQAEFFMTILCIISWI